METSGVSSGLLGSVRSLADNLLGSVHDRVELISVELQEEKQRLIQIFIWISVAMQASNKTRERRKRKNDKR